MIRLLLINYSKSHSLGTILRDGINEVVTRFFPQLTRDVNFTSVL